MKDAEFRHVQWELLGGGKGKNPFCPI
jgi:hypothetical protein